MRCLNSPVGMNPVEQNILDQFPSDAKCGVVIGAGDGRLTQAIHDQFGQNIKIYSIEHRKPLFEHLKSLDNVAQDPWDLEWFKRTAREEGGFDFIIFHNIHAYWHGNVNTFHEQLQLLKPTGLAWMSFYNSATLYELGRNMPPHEAGYQRLSNWLDMIPKMDFNSWRFYFSGLSIPIKSVWGLLQEDAFEYCQKKEKPKATWYTHNVSIEVNDLGDAYLYGAPVVCFQIASPNSQEKHKTEFLGVKYNSSMLQAILFPYAEVMPEEMSLINTKVSVNVRAQNKDPIASPFLEFFVDQLKDFKNVKKVLLLGCDWGEDLLALKALKPEWECVGTEASKDKISAGEHLVKNSEVQVIHCNPSGKLPFNDGAFDLVVSLGYFSTIYQPLALHLAEEMLRVAKKGVAHFEDLRGPDYSMDLKLYSLQDVYKELGQKTDLLPIDIDKKPTGMYIAKVRK